MSYKYIAITKQWRDKVNGNSYFSSVVEDLSGNIVLKVPFQYGYATHSESVINEELAQMFSKSMCGDDYKDSNNCIKFIKMDKCTKREVIEHAK